MRLLIDHGGYANLGDAAMLEGVVTRLREVLPEADLHVVDHEVVPTSIMDMANVQPVDLRIPEPSLRDKRFLWRFQRLAGPLYRRVSMSRAGRGSASAQLTVEGPSTATTLGQFCSSFDSLHVVGGGNLTDVFERQWWNRCCVMNTFAAQGKPVVLTGQQIGPFRSAAIRRLVMDSLRAADLAGLREPGSSAELCRAAGLDESRVQTLGDDSFGVSAADDPSVDKVLSAHGIRRGEFLAVNLRIAPYAGEHGNHLTWFGHMISRVADRLGVPVVFVPISLGSTDSDARTGHLLAEQVPGLIVADRVAWSPSLVKGFLGASRGAVGASYHFCTFALSQAVPAVCVYRGDYYGQKAHGMATFWGCDRIPLELGSMTVNDAADRTIETLNDPANLLELSQRAVSYSEQWHAVFERQVAPLHRRIVRHREAG